MTKNKVFKSSFSPDMFLNEFHQKHQKSNFFWIVFQSIGIVYGDIATNCLFTYKSFFASSPDPLLKSGDLSDPYYETRRIQEVLGVTSLVVWLLILIPFVKYLFCIFKADNDGEGGIFALVSLLTNGSKSVHQFTPKMQHIMFLVSIFGSTFLIGDGIVTAAISVVSAMEAVPTYSPGLKPLVIPMACLIHLLLFMSQRFGTEKVGNVFAPVLSVWLLSLFSIGMYNCIINPDVFTVFNPVHIVRYASNIGFSNWFISISGTMLVICGVEALFVDLGHFSKASIRVSWSFFVFPALIFQYMGQASVLMRDPAAYADPFFLSVPRVLYWPMFALALLASIVASQSLVSGCFALIDQAISLHFFPRVKSIRTSKTQRGQVYIPAVNYFLMFSVISLILILQASEKIAPLYAIFVTGDMALSSLFYVFVMYYTWNSPKMLIALYVLVFCTMDGFMLASALVKIPDGGWITLVFSIPVFTMMYVWYTTNLQVEKALQRKLLDVDDLCFMARTLTRSKGMTVFVSYSEEDVPTPLGWFMTRANVLPSVVVCLTIHASHRPVVPDELKVIVKPIDVRLGLYRMVLQYGYGEPMMKPDDAIEIALKKELIQLSEPRAALLTSDSTTSFTSEDLPITFMIGRDYPCASPSAHWYTRLRVSAFNVILKQLDPPSLFFKLSTDSTTELANHLILSDADRYY